MYTNDPNGQSPQPPQPYQGQYPQGYVPQQNYQQPQYSPQQVYQQTPQYVPQQNYQPMQPVPEQPYQQPVQYAQEQPYQQPVQYAQEQQSQQYQQAAQYQAYVPVEAWEQYQQPPQPVYQHQPYPQQGAMGHNYTAVKKAETEKNYRIPYDVLVRVMVFGVLPVLFVLMLLTGIPALKVVFMVATVIGLAMMWMRVSVSPNVRFISTLISAVAFVVALVFLVNGPMEDRQNIASAQSGGNRGSGSIVTTAPPTATPTPSPNPYDNDDPGVDLVMSFFYYWAENNDAEMLKLCAPSWRNSNGVDEQKQMEALFRLKNNRYPVQGKYDVDTVEQESDRPMRTIYVSAQINKNVTEDASKRTTNTYYFTINLLKEEGVWYVNPESIRSYEAEVSTPTPATANTTPTQPPLYTGTPTTLLYYNPNGGSKYHLDPDCTEVHAKYKPMASFYFSQVLEEPYKELYACNVCGAPIPDD